MYSHADRYGGFRDYSSFPDQIGRADDIGIDGRGFHHDGFGRRAIFDDRDDYSMRSSRIEYPGFPIREEDWRSSSFARRMEPAVDSWKRGVSTHSWASDRTTASDNWRKEGTRSPRVYEDWRAERSWRRSPSPRWRRSPSPRWRRSPSPRRVVSPSDRHGGSRHSSEGRDARKDSPSVKGKNPPDPLKKGSITNLNEDELEKAARLQLQLMAEMESNENKKTSKKKEESHPKKEKETTKVGNSSKKEADSEPAAPTQKQINPPETGSHSKARPEENDNKQTNTEEKEKPKTEHGGSLVVKKNFEDIHMFARERAPAGIASHAVRPTEVSWVEQYKMSVNKRKQELCSGTPVPVPVARSSSPGRYDVHRGIVPRVPPRLPDYRPEPSATLGTRAAPREYFQDPKQSYFEEAAYDHAEEISVKQSRSHTSIDPKQFTHTSIDPKQFIEELSDSEDWEEVVQLVTQPPTLKRPAEIEIERPVKRGLLGSAPLQPTKIPQNGPVVTSGRPFPPGFIPPPTLKPPTLTVKSSVPVPRVKPPAPAPHPSMEEKSFFRMEYPSVTPKIYYSHPPVSKQEKSNESSEPAQARIAPAAPLPSEHGSPFNWRHEQGHPVSAEPLAKHGGVESMHGGYFN